MKVSLGGMQKQEFSTQKPCHVESWIYVTHEDEEKGRGREGRKKKAKQFNFSPARGRFYIAPEEDATCRGLLHFSSPTQRTNGPLEIVPRL